MKELAAALVALAALLAPAAARAQSLLPDPRAKALAQIKFPLMK